MHYYIEAYNRDSLPILGNLDGQACIEAKIPQRTFLWKRFFFLSPARPFFHKVKFWRLVDEKGTLIATASNNYFQENANV